MKQLTISYPENISDEEFKYFEGKNVITFAPQQVRKLRNVFVSHEGLCVKNGVFLTRSAFNMIGNEDNTHFFEFWKLATEQYLVSKFGKSLKLQQLKGDYLLVHSKWFNFYFWLTSSLYRLYLTKHEHKNVTLLLPEQIAKNQFVQDSLLMFPSLKTQVIPSGEHLEVESLLFPECRKWSVSISSEAIRAIKSTVLTYAHEHRKRPEGLSTKLFITRKKTGKRGIVNEQEVEELLVLNGFSVISFEDYDIYEQALIMEKATHVIGLHGAGFGNILYMNPGGFLYELMAHPPTLKDQRTGFWRLSGVVGLRYMVQFCEFDIDPSLALFMDNNYHVAIQRLKENLKIFLNTSDK